MTDTEMAAMEAALARADWDDRHNLPFIDCADFPDVGCCTSCHTDDVEGYGYMIDVDGYSGYLCCDKVHWLADTPEGRAIAAAMHVNAAFAYRENLKARIHG